MTDATSVDDGLKPAKKLTMADFAPERQHFLQDVIEGLSNPQKTIPPKYFYDERGSQLFDRICELDEYYPTRTELAILRDNIDEIAEVIGPRCLLIEYGSGSSLKTRILLDHIDDLAAYVPLDISKDHLRKSATDLAASYPGLAVVPVCADFTADFEVPAAVGAVGRRVVFFPGSTIGNFEHDQALSFLRHTADACGEGGGLLIGVDLIKDVAVLEAAYNDRDGVTAAFNLNLLKRINRELGADFCIEAFEHRAKFNAALSRIEMHLVSRKRQKVAVDGTVVSFDEGDTIHTESSHKFALDDFRTSLAEPAGFTVRRIWTDPRRFFSVQYLTAA